MATIICKKCGTENPPENLFCQVCGTSMKGVQPSEGERTVMVSRDVPAMPTPPEVKPVPPPQIKAEAVSEVPFIPVVPPPPMAVPTPPVFSGTPIHKLGASQDNWSELVEGAADKINEIGSAFDDEVKKADIPGVNITTSILTSGTSEPRKYYLVHNGKGATVAVRFAAFGKDLYYSWELFTRRTINWLTIGILLGVAFLLALIPAILTWINGSFFYGVYTLVSSFLGILLVPGLALLLFGKLFKDDIWGLFVKDLDDFAMDDADALETIVDDCVSLAIEDVLEV